MSVSALNFPIYRLPPYTVGPEILMTNFTADVIDWGLKAHGIEQQWATTKGEGILVGVADTGCPDHPELKDAVIESRNFSSSATDKDTQGHSTHVCGVIAAAENNTGVIGVAHKAKIMTAKVLGDDGSGDNLSVAQGIRWLTSRGCHVINLSLGGGMDATISRACKDAVDSGVFVICAAGNDGYVSGRNTVGYPAKLPYTIAVASYNKSGKLSDYSSRGPEVHIAFPGEDILSTWPGGGYRRLSGTSMATPFASATVALLLSYQNKRIEQGNPPVTLIRNNMQLIDRLKSAAVDRGPAGFDSGWGWGIVDIDKFLEMSGASAELGVGNTGEPTVGMPNDTDMLFGLLRARYPVVVDGKTGIFLYFP